MYISASQSSVRINQNESFKMTIFMIPTSFRSPDYMITNKTVS